MKIIKITVVLLSLILTSSSYSQISLQLGPAIGYTSPSGDYSGTPLEYYNGTNYGLSGAVHYGATGRLKILFIAARVSVLYASLSNSGITGSGNQTTEVKHNLLTIAVGPEFIFGIPFTPLSPYIGIDLLFTSFSGESIFHGMSGIPSDGTYSMSSASRTGLGVGFGLNVSVSKKFSIDGSLKYNLHNLFSKSFEGGDNRIDSYTSLNDDADPNYSVDPSKHPIANSRSIQTIQISLGFLYNF